MAQFAPLRTGQFVIKPRSLNRQRAGMAALVLLLAALPYVTYELGRSRAGFSIVQALHVQQEQKQQIKALDARVTQLQRDLSNARLDSQAQAQAFSAEQQSVATLQTQLQQQQQDLALYRAIVSPTAGASDAPRVQRLEIEPLSVPQQFQLRLMLIQAMSAGPQAQGELKVQISGTQQDKPVTLGLAQLQTGSQPAELSFAYRYFQTVELVVVLPAGFEPASVQVEVHAMRHEVLRQTFPWQLKTQARPQSLVQAQATPQL